MGSSTIQIGDFIRDIEDGDCYYEGIVISINPVEYRITSVMWCGVHDSALIGTITNLMWWNVVTIKSGQN